MKLIKKVGKVIIGIFLSLFFFLLMLFRNDIPEEAIIRKYSTPESHFIEVDGINLHVRFFGQGEPVFLIHGGFSSLHTWDVWQQEMSPYFMTISVDLPGHGLTGPDVMQRYTIAEYSQLIIRLAEKLSLPGFHIAGNSLGGAVALQVASTHPDQVLSLNLIDTFGAPSPEPRGMERENSTNKESWILKFSENPVFFKFLLKCTPKFLFSMNIRKIYGKKEKITGETIDRYFELMLREGNRQAALDRLKKPKNSSIQFERVTMPTLIMWGKKDSWVPLNQAFLLEKAIPGSNVIIFEEAGHVPMEEIPKESVTEYLSFLGVEVRKEYFQEPKLISYVD